MTLSLITAIQHWLIMLYHQTNFGSKRIISSEDIAETVIFWLYWSSPHCDLDIEGSNPGFCCCCCCFSQDSTDGHMDPKRWTTTQNKIFKKSWKRGGLVHYMVFFVCLFSCVCFVLFCVCVLFCGGGGGGGHAPLLYITCNCYYLLHCHQQSWIQTTCLLWGHVCTILWSI